MPKEAEIFPDCLNVYSDTGLFLSLIGEWESGDERVNFRFSLMVRARWSCRALTATWAYTAPSAGTRIPPSVRTRASFACKCTHEHNCDSLFIQLFPRSSQPPSPSLLLSLLSFHLLLSFTSVSV